MIINEILLEFPYKLRSTSELFTVLHNDLMVLLLHSNDRSNIKSLANNYFKCVDRQSGKTYYWYSDDDNNINIITKIEPVKGKYNDYVSFESSAKDKKSNIHMSDLYDVVINDQIKNNNNVMLSGGMLTIDGFKLYTRLLKNQYKIYAIDTDSSKYPIRLKNKSDLEKYHNTSSGHIRYLISK